MIRIIPLSPFAKKDGFFRPDPSRFFTVRFHRTKSSYRAALRHIPSAAVSEAVFLAPGLRVDASGILPPRNAPAAGKAGAFHFVVPWIDRAHLVHEASHASVLVLGSASVIADLTAPDPDEFLAQSVASLFSQLEKAAAARGFLPS